ncbi:MAG: hybrid sensor histidine kinase/response regulator [Bacteroidota bacterium]
MKKFNILYVDDEASNLRIFKNTFRRTYNVFLAESAKEGIDILENNEIDLVLSDQRMPQMTGVEFLKYSLQKFPQSSRILISGYSDIKAVEDAINTAHIFQYVQKPWKESDLHKTINDALHIYQLEQENIRQQQELKIAKNKAEENDRLKTAFLSNLSHEIRTPMNGIIGFSNMLKDPKISHDDREKFTDIINKSCYKLLATVNDVIDISKIETGQAVLRNVMTNINDVILERVEFHRQFVNENELAITAARLLPEDASVIALDKVKLKQIFDNLLNNAIKFTSEGYVEVGCELKNEGYEFYIKDTGIGIPENQLELVFERFSQGSEDIAQNYGGTGLGLSIANAYVKMLGGTMRVESEPNTGSTFYFTLPPSVSI